MISNNSVVRKLGSGIAVDDTRSAVSQVLESLLESLLNDRTGSAIYQPTVHALQTPGKLLRALILLDACSAVGGNPESVLPAAAGLEAGHSPA